MRRPMASAGWWAMLAGIALFGVGIVAILAASIQGMQREPGLGLIDGYWVGLLPWMGIGTWLVPLGAVLAVAGGSVRVLTSRLPVLVRLASLAGVAVVLFWALIAVSDMAPRSRGYATTSSDLATVVYSRPEVTVAFLLIPMGLIVALAFAGRRWAR